MWPKAFFLFVFACPFARHSVGYEPIRRPLRSGQCRTAAHPSCGMWQENYIRTQQNVLAGRSLQRYSVAVLAPTGLADKLLGIVATFYYALLTDRAFQIFEGTGPHAIPFEVAYQQVNINWTASLDYAYYIRHSEGIESRAPSHTYKYQNFLHQKNTFDLLLSKWDGTSESDAVDVVLTMGNRGISQNMFQNSKIAARLSEMGLMQETAFGCAINFLFSLRPEVEQMLAVEMAILSQSHHLFFAHAIESGTDEKPVATTSKESISDQQVSQIQDEAPRTGILTIGIQIRLGDGAFNSESTDWTLVEKMGFFKCAQQIEDRHRLQNQQVVWYLISDSQIVRKTAQQQFGRKIITHADAHVQHTAAHDDGSPNGKDSLDVNGMRTAVGEHWIFGMTDFQVNLGSS